MADGTRSLSNASLISGEESTQLDAVTGQRQYPSERSSSKEKPRRNVAIGDSQEVDQGQSSSGIKAFTSQPKMPTPPKTAPPRSRRRHHTIQGPLRKSSSGGRSAWRKERTKSRAFDSSSPTPPGGPRLSGAGPTLRRSGARVLTSGKTQPVLSTGSKGHGDAFLGEELMRLPLFEACSQLLISEISASACMQSYPPGATIIKEGAPGASFVFVLRGIVFLIVDELKLQRLYPGQCYGETLLLSIDDESKAGLRADTACSVCHIRREDFLEALESFPTEQRFYEKVRAKHKSVDFLWEGTLDRPCELFKSLSERAIRHIDRQIVRRMYFPNERILQEGAPGDEFYILVRGRVTIEIASRVVRTERRDRQEESLLTKEDSSIGVDTASTEVEDSPVCFGELGLLGVQQVRSATVVAQSVCQVRVLYRAAFLRTLEETGEALHEMKAFFQKRYSSGIDKLPAVALQQLFEISIFREVGCSEDFLAFLGEHLEDRIYLRGQTIINEDLPEDKCMYLIGHGSVKVKKEGHEVATLSDGAVFGEITVLGVASKRSSTVVAMETCYMQVLHRSVVVRGLELFPEERRKVLMMALKKEDAYARATAGQPASSSSGSAEVGQMAASATSGQEEAPEEEAEEEDTISDVSPVRRKRESLTSCYSYASFCYDPFSAKAGSLQRAFMKVLRSSLLFSNTSPAFVDEVGTVAIDRIYMPGDAILQEGQRGDSMFIMVSGEAGVFVSDLNNMPGRQVDEGVMHVGALEVGKNNASTAQMTRIGTLQAGSISGELAMLGISMIRSATVEAETICSMWEITQEKALEILQRFPDAQEHFANVIVKHLERTVPTRMASVSLFHGFDRKLRTLLGLYAERRVFFPGQFIVKESHGGESLYIINVGRATLEKKGIAIKTFSVGSHFGSGVMLGFSKAYVGSLVASQTCHVLSIARTSYLQALDHYPSVQAANELIRSEKAATEALKEVIQRISARKLIWKRYQGLNHEEGTMLVLGAMPDSEFSRRVLQCWLQSAREHRHLRKMREREKVMYRQMIQQWSRKKQEAKERARLKHEKAEAEEQLHTTARRPPKARGHSAEAAQLVAMLKAWPTPRPSPYYNLRVWEVLAAELGRPMSTTPLLPLLTPPTTAGSSIRPRAVSVEPHHFGGGEADGLMGTGRSSVTPGRLSRKASVSFSNKGDDVVASMHDDEDEDSTSSDEEQEPGSADEVLNRTFSSSRLSQHEPASARSSRAMQRALGSIVLPAPLEFNQVRRESHCSTRSESRNSRFRSGSAFGLRDA